MYKGCGHVGRTPLWSPSRGLRHDGVTTIHSIIVNFDIFPSSDISCSWMFSTLKSKYSDLHEAPFQNSRSGIGVVKCCGTATFDHAYFPDVTPCENLESTWQSIYNIRQAIRAVPDGSAKKPNAIVDTLIQAGLLSILFLPNGQLVTAIGTTVNVACNLQGIKNFNFSKKLLTTSRSVAKVIPELCACTLGFVYFLLTYAGTDAEMLFHFPRRYMIIVRRISSPYNDIRRTILPISKPLPLLPRRITRASKKRISFVGEHKGQSNVSSPNMIFLSMFAKNNLTTYCDWICACRSASVPATFSHILGDRDETNGVASVDMHSVICPTKDNTFWYSHASVGRAAQIHN